MRWAEVWRLAGGTEDSQPSCARWAGISADLMLGAMVCMWKEYLPMSEKIHFSVASTDRKGSHLGWCCQAQFRQEAEVQ